MQDTIFKLEVGKTYRTRNGEGKSTIVGKNDHSTLCFVDDDGCTYTEEGRFFSLQETEHDLVEEVSSSELTLEVGKSYHTRDGLSIVKIISTEDQLADDTEDNRPFLGNNEEYYGETGNFNFDPSIPSDYDLIKEVE